MMKPWTGELDKYRVTSGPWGSGPEHGRNGLFVVPLGGVLLTIIVSDQDGWEHASVTIRDKHMRLVRRTPHWSEMCYVKDLLWAPNETVLQYHPADEDYVDLHPFCLHLWRPVGLAIPKPPKAMVG